jgi:hypothetical protein
VKNDSIVVTYENRNYTIKSVQVVRAGDDRTPSLTAIVIGILGVLVLIVGLVWWYSSTKEHEAAANDEAQKRFSITKSVIDQIKGNKVGVSPVIEVDGSEHGSVTPSRGSGVTPSAGVVADDAEEPTYELAMAQTESGDEQQVDDNVDTALFKPRGAPSITVGASVDNDDDATTTNNNNNDDDNTDAKPEFTCTCGKKATLICSQCKLVGYCSVECQRSDWKTHRSACKKERKRRQSRARDAVDGEHLHQQPQDDDSGNVNTLPIPTLPGQVNTPLSTPTLQRSKIGELPSPSLPTRSGGFPPMGGGRSPQRPGGGTSPTSRLPPMKRHGDLGASGAPMMRQRQPTLPPNVRKPATLPGFDTETDI